MPRSLQVKSQGALKGIDCYSNAVPRGVNTKDVSFTPAWSKQQKMHCWGKTKKCFQYANTCTQGISIIWTLRLKVFVEQTLWNHCIQEDMIYTKNLPKEVPKAFCKSDGGLPIACNSRSSLMRPSGTGKLWKREKIQFRLCAKYKSCRICSINLPISVEIPFKGLECQLLCSIGGGTCRHLIVGLGD